MSIDSVTKLLREARMAPADAWNRDAMDDLSTRETPDILFRDRKVVLKGDQTRLWLRWFIEGLATPWAFITDPSKSKLHVFEAAIRNVERAYPDADRHQIEELAIVVSDRIFEEVLRRRNVVRDYANLDLKRALVADKPVPRCYLCGYAFTKEAVDALLRVKGSNKPVLPSLIDILRPRGLHSSDIRVEIEHIVPVAIGGQGQKNLALACGWCNRYKNARVSIYDAPTASSRVLLSLGTHQLYELPEPYWVVRTLAVHRRCQHISGCKASADDQEIFVALRDWNGSPNPTNLRFYCAAHDPISSERFFNPTEAGKIWKDRKRGR